MQLIKYIHYVDTFHNNFRMLPLISLVAPTNRRYDYELNMKLRSQVSHRQQAAVFFLLLDLCNNLTLSIQDKFTEQVVFRTTRIDDLKFVLNPLAIFQTINQPRSFSQSFYRADSSAKVSENKISQNISPENRVPDKMHMYKEPLKSKYSAADLTSINEQLDKLSDEKKQELENRKLFEGGVPAKFYDPINLNIINEPVPYALKTSNGLKNVCYDKSTIQDWIKRTKPDEKPSDPTTKQEILGPVDDREMIKDFDDYITSLKKALDDFALEESVKIQPNL